MIECQECHKEFKTQKALFVHITKKHIKQEYYDKWILTKKETCEICGAETKFKGLREGYKRYCDEHYHEWNYQQIESTIIEKYGVKSYLCLQDKKEEAIQKKYGVKNVFQNIEIKEKIKQTNIKKYGVDNPYKSKEIKEKIKQQHIKNHGVEYPSQSPEIQLKIKEAFKKHYNVEYALQNSDLHNKQQKTAFYSYKYKSTSLNYRGSYELDFLENYFSKYSDIQNGPSIKYILDDKQKIYFPDFYIPSLNLIIECKNSYLLKKDAVKIKAKEKATIANGFKYILIVDKNYEDFEKLLLW